MLAFRINLNSDTVNTPSTCLGYRSQLKTAQIIAKEYMKEQGATNEVWQPEVSRVQFLIDEILWRIYFEEINIEY